MRQFERHLEYEIFYKDLFTQLRKRIPQNPKLVARLVEILPLEKEAVYRRLRQEVPFAFEEIMTIAKAFNISLDNMMGTDVQPTFPFKVQSTKNENPIEINYSILEEYIQAIKDVASDPHGEISLVTNVIPQSLYTGFQCIYHFFYFKWRYYSIPTNQTKTYHEIKLSDRLLQIIEDIFVYSKKVKSSYFILDNQIFQKIVKDVTFFNSIRLLRNEDIDYIKDDLLQFISYMETIAVKGFVDNPSNEVFFYISDTSIDSSYSYIDSQSSIRFALFWSFIFNNILTFDEETLDMVKHHIRSKIRTSTPLSVTGERQRTQYFETQRKIVEQL
jgi:hypothetical protein